MATITVASTGVNRLDSILGRQGNDTINIAGNNTSTFFVDQDTAYGLNATPMSRVLGTISGSATVGGSLALEGRYVRYIPFNSGTGSVPYPGVTISQGSASGKLIGVWSSLTSGAESVGAAMPTSGYLKINQWNEVPYTATTITIPSTTGSNLVSATVSGMEGINAATDFTVTAGAATLTNSLTFAQAGSKSLRIATTSTTTTTVKMANGTRFMVGAGLAVTVSGYIRGSDVKSCTLAIEWFDATNASISTDTIQTQNCSNSGFTQYTAAAVTAPANTKWASINVTVTSPTNGGFYYVDSLTATPGNWSTGATATAPDKVAPIEVVSLEGVNHVLTAAGQRYYSDFSFCKGSWYEIGTTDGNRATTYQIPTNGNLSYHGGVLVDKAAAVNITAASWSGGVATFTATAHGLTTGDRVFIGGVLPRAYTSDINAIEACTVLTANTFSIPMATNPGSYTSGGTVAAVEWYPTTTSLNTAIRTEAVPGKVCWLDPATGLLRFGNDNITSTGGYCPATGLKVRIPNVMTAAVAAGHATPLTNALAATTTSRCRFYAGTTVGKIVASQMSGTWNTTVIQLGDYANINDCVFVGNMVIASEASPSAITFNCFGGNAASTFTNGIGLSTMLSGTTITDNTICVGELSASKIGMSLATAEDITVSGNKIIGTGDRTSTTTWGYILNIGGTATITNTTMVNIGGPIITSQFSSINLLETHYWGSGAGGVPIANAQAMFSIGNVSGNWLVDGFYVDQPGPFNVMRGAWITTAGNSNDLIFRNMGTYASPIDAGSVTYTDKAFSRTTTTATITHTAHGLRNNDIIFVMAATDTSTTPVSSARAAIVPGVKTITYIDANTYSFTCLNAGPTSGTIDYYIVGMPAALLAQGSNNVLYQNIHLRGHGSGGISGSNASSIAKHQNVTLDPRAGAITINRANFNQTFTSGMHQGYEYTAGASAVLGTHFMDYYVRASTTPGTDAPVTGVSWSRSGVLCTITKTAHGLYDNQRIYIENSTNQTAIPNGVKELSVIVIDKNTFSIAAVNSGTTSGTLDYRLPGDGYFHITCNAPSPLTSSYITLSSTANFTGSGTLYAPAVNDQVIWELPEYMIGWDHIAKFPGYVYGNSVTDSNYDLYYAINTGSGWSSYKNLSYKRAGASGSAAATTFTVTNATGVNVGDYVYGIGIAGGAKVTNVNTGTNTITVDIAHTAAVSGIVSFNYGPNESTFPAGGVKFRIKLVTNTTNTGTLYGVWMGLVSTETTRATLYSQLDQYTLSFVDLVSGSDIRIVEAGTATSILDVDANSGTTYNYDYYYGINPTVDIYIHKDGYEPFAIYGYDLEAEDSTLLVAQVLNRNEGV